MTLLSADPKQFQIKDDGQIYFQADATNPLPGTPIARLMKGETPLNPLIEWREDAPLEGVDLLAATDKIVTWFGLYKARVLESLVTLPVNIETLPAPVQDICLSVHDHLGIVPRQDLIDQIEKLNADMRKTLRNRHIRLGPVLVFVPDLNKPAAVRLRAILWSLYNDKPLPAPVPKDGVVSVVIDPSNADPVFYQAIGYPLYGNRIIRIDMLDRVMNAAYEGVKDNIFQAKHQMAEWLGCSIPDLYAVLEAMGHKKISGQAPSETVTLPVVVVPDSPQTQESSVQESVVGDENKPESTPAEVQGDTKPQPPKPELALFRVWWPRRKKEHEIQRRRAPQKTKGDKSAPPPFEYLSPDEVAAKKEPRSDRKESDPSNEDQEKGKKPFHRKESGYGDRSSGKGFGSRKPSKPNRLDKNLRLVSSAKAPDPKPEDSPFAILAGLKFKQD